MLLATASSTDERTIIDAAIAGDAEAFAELFDRYYRIIHAYAYQLCLNEADAQDIAQETFIKAARALPHYRPDSAFRNWLYQICTNATRDWQRQSGRRQRIAAVAEERTHIASSERPADLALAHDALASLAPDLRAAVVLIYLEGMNHAEAARLLGCAETTISWRIFRAKRKLKSHLQ